MRWRLKSPASPCRFFWYLSKVVIIHAFMKEICLPSIVLIYKSLICWLLNSMDGTIKYLIMTTYRLFRCISKSLAFVRGIHRWPVNSPHNWPATRKMFPFDDVIVRRAGLLLSQQDFEWRWSVPLFQCLTVLEFSFILFDLCLLITFFNFIMNYVPIVTFLDIYLS